MRDERLPPPFHCPLRVAVTRNGRPRWLPIDICGILREALERHPRSRIPQELRETLIEDFEWGLNAVLDELLAAPPALEDCLCRACNFFRSKRKKPSPTEGNPPVHSPS